MLSYIWISLDTFAALKIDYPYFTEKNTTSSLVYAEKEKIISL